MTAMKTSNNNDDGDMVEVVGERERKSGGCGRRREREKKKLIYFNLIKNTCSLVFYFKSQPLNFILPHVLHPKYKWTKWSIR